MRGRARGLAVVIAWTLSQTILATDVAGQGLSLITQPIPAQPVDSALTELSRQTGLQIVYMSRVAERVTSSAVPSGLPSDEALRRLLADTDLEFEFLDRRTVTILPRRPPSPSSPQGYTAGREAGYIRLAQVEPSPTLRAPTRLQSLRQAEDSAGGSSLEEVVAFAPGFEVLLVPGHSPAHTALWEPESRSLFSGDVALGRPHELH